MKKIRKTLLIMMFFTLFLPKSTHAYYSTIDSGNVTIKEIVRHFKGNMDLKKNDKGRYYSEFIFDGSNLIIENNKGYVLINGIPKPIETIERDGVILPVYHKVNHIWDNVELPASFFVSEFDYVIEDKRLIYDKPLGIYEVEIKEPKASDTDSAKDSIQNHHNQNPIGNSKNDAINKVSDENSSHETDSDVKINTGNEEVDTNDKNDKDQETNVDQEQEEIEEPAEDEDEDEDDIEVSEPEDLPVGAMRVFDSTYVFGRYFGIGSSYQEQQQCINDDNIIILWDNLVHSNKRASLVIGKGNTVFKELQGTLSNGVKFTVSDITGNLREYEIKESIKVPLDESNKKHKELYERYRLNDVFIIQLQENNKMSFYVSF